MEEELTLAKANKRFGDNMGVAELEKRQQYYQDADRLYEEAEKESKSMQKQKEIFYIKWE